MIPLEIRGKLYIISFYELPMVKQDMLITGAGIGGMQEASNVADNRCKVVLLDKSFPTNDCSICTAAPKMIETGRYSNIDLLTYAEIEKAEGDRGRFRVTIWVCSSRKHQAWCVGCCPVDVLNEFDRTLSPEGLSFYSPLRLFLLSTLLMLKMIHLTGLVRMAMKNGKD